MSQFLKNMYRPNDVPKGCSKKASNAVSSITSQTVVLYNYCFRRNSKFASRYNLPVKSYAMKCFCFTLRILFHNICNHNTKLTFFLKSQRARWTLKDRLSLDLPRSPSIVIGQINYILICNGVWSLVQY